jgi:predicted ATPase
MFNFFDYDKSFELESKFKDYYFNSDYNSDKAINLKSSIEKKINKKLDEIFKNFSIYAKFVFEISNKTFRIDFRNKNEKFFIEDKNPQNSSSGFNSFFQIIFKTNIYKNQDFNNPILFLFDEPEKNLYLKLQVELLKYMKKIMQDNNNLYILFSTHSPYMIDSKNQNIIHIERDEYGSSKIRNLTNFKDNSLSGESRKLIQDSLTLSDANQKLKKEEILKTKVIRYHSKLKKNNKFISQILESEEIKLKFDLIEDDKNRDNSIAILDFTKNGESVISLINDYYIDLSDNESIDIYMK